MEKKKLIKIEGTESRIIQNEMLRYRWALLCWVKEGRAELLLYLVELPRTGVLIIFFPEH